LLADANEQASQPILAWQCIQTKAGCNLGKTAPKVLLAEFVYDFDDDIHSFTALSCIE
jgi:hypothetical protein